MSQYGSKQENAVDFYRKVPFKFKERTDKY